MTANETFVYNLGRGLLFSELSSTEITYWATQIEKGFTTPLLLTFKAAEESRFLNENLPLATMYYTLYGVFPSINEMIVWRKLLDSGASLNDIGTAFTDSSAFYTRYPDALNSTSSKLNILITASGVTTISSSLKQEAISRLDAGTLEWGEVLTYLVELSGKHLHSALALLWTTTKGTIPSLSDITALGSNAQDAVSKFYTIYNPNSLAPSESADTIVGTSTADTIRGLGGNDKLSGGNGIDTFIFEKDSASNGVDTITDFKIGKGGDILSFSLFLNKPNDTNMATVSSISTAAKAWSNGDVLIVSGNGLTTSEAIASIFGAGKALAAPVNASKCIVISADIIGDASIWYITNQTTTNAISASEVTLIGTLSDINNIGLVGFHTDNII